MAKLDANAVIRARIDEDTKTLLERAARAEGLTLSAWMRLHLIRMAEEVLARGRRVAELSRGQERGTSRFVR